MPKTPIALITLFCLTLHVFGQKLSHFDTKLYSEKITLCDLIGKYVDTKEDFKYVPFDSSFFSVSYYNNVSEIFGSWSYVVRHDSLNQYGFSSTQLPITSEWYHKLFKLTDSTIKLFTDKYGQPAKDTLVKVNLYKKGAKFRTGTIRKAMWLIDGQKLKVDFSIVGEHNQYSYRLHIQRFKDYYGNMNLPPWWDGY